MAMWGREVVEKAFFVDPDIAKAETLPAYAFEDPDVLSLELSTLFAKTWLLVPEKTAESGPSRMDFLRSPGSRAPFSILGRELFLQRSRNGELRCFPNVCTHAWHTLVRLLVLAGVLSVLSMVGGLTRMEDFSHRQALRILR